MQVYNDEQLYHHGVIGMKWGHHKIQITNSPTFKTNNGDVVLKKGTKFQRIATNSNSGFTKGVYTSYKSADKDLYKGVLGRMRVSSLLKEHGEIKLSEITMVAGKDIAIPSKETRIEEFKKLYKQNPDGVAALINEHQKTRYGRDETNYSENRINNKTKTEYQKFNDALSLSVNSKNGKVIQQYYDNLQKRGYDAIPDENDIKLSTFKAQAPIIMFDTKSSIGKTTQRTLSASEVYSAYNRSIGKKTVRDILYRGNIGFEKLKNDSRKSQNKYNRQLKKDKYELSNKYTIENLAKDWGKNRLTKNQIKKVSDLMDDGYNHEEAVTKVIGLGNTLTDKVMTKLKM